MSPLDHGPLGPGTSQMCSKYLMRGGRLGVLSTPGRHLSTGAPRPGQSITQSNWGSSRTLAFWLEDSTLAYLWLLLFFGNIKPPGFQKYLWGWHGGRRRGPRGKERRGREADACTLITRVALTGSGSPVSLKPCKS